MPIAVITLNLDPYLHLGPVLLAWHGVMIAVGIVVGAWLAGRYARERGLDTEGLGWAVLVVAMTGIVGARLFWLVQHGEVLQPDEWLGTRGFSFYGAMLVGAPAAALYLRRAGLGIRHLDALAAGFPLGMAVGRIGDVINGEHFGPASDLPWAIRYTHPGAEVPSAGLAYHPGGLYELVLGLVVLAIVWPLRRRFERPGQLLATVVALYAAGRFVMFFYRSDATDLALGLTDAQWTSLAVLGAAGVALLAGPAGGLRRAPTSSRAAPIPGAPSRWRARR